MTYAQRAKRLNGEWGTANSENWKSQKVKMIRATCCDLRLRHIDVLTCLRSMKLKGRNKMGWDQSRPAPILARRCIVPDGLIGPRLVRDGSFCLDGLKDFARNPRMTRGSDRHAADRS